MDTVISQESVQSISNYSYYHTAKEGGFYFSSVCMYIYFFGTRKPNPLVVFLCEQCGQIRLNRDNDTGYINIKNIPSQIF